MEDYCTGDSAVCVDTIRDPNFICTDTSSSVCMVCGTSNSSCPVSSVSTCTGVNNGCENNNGGCDHSVLCTLDGAGHTRCGSCPTGTYGDGYIKCYPYCGDGICDPTIENCVTCPQDCKAKQCSICGDGSCDASVGENCTTCQEDCGNCYVTGCTDPTCGGHGVCNNGLCVCSSTWTGPTCSSPDSLPITTTTNVDQPSVNIESPGFGNFSVSIQSISEINPNGEIIRSYSISNLNFSVEQTTNGTNKVYVYGAVLENGASVNVTIWQLNEDTIFEFANTSTLYHENTIKVGIRVENWPFLSLANRLQILMDSDAASEGACIRNQLDESGNTRWVVIMVGDVALYGQFLDKAVVDGRIRNITYNWNSDGSAVGAILPHFWDFADMDPNYSVLLTDQDTRDECGNKLEGNSQYRNNNKIILIAVFVSAGVVGLIILGVVFGPRIHMHWTVWKTNKSRSKLREMDDFSRSNSLPSVII